MVETYLNATKKCNSSHETKKKNNTQLNYIMWIFNVRSRAQIIYSKYCSYVNLVKYIHYVYAMQPSTGFRDFFSHFSYAELQFNKFYSPIFFPISMYVRERMGNCYNLRRFTNGDGGWVAVAHLLRNYN